MKKPLVIILVALLVLALAGIGWLTMSFLDSYSEDPATVEAVREQILDLPVPDELLPQHSLSFLGASLAVYYAEDDPRQTLVLASFPRKAIEDSDATWTAQTQIEWEEYDPEVKIEERSAEFKLFGQQHPASISTVSMKDGTYRAYVLDLDWGGEEVIKLFLSGRESEWTDHEFQGWLDHAKLPAAAASN